MTEPDIIKNRFEESYETLIGPVFRHCQFRLKDRERAKEIAQEAFMKTWDYLREGNEIENMKAFVYRVAHNLVMNERMRKRTSASLDQMAEEEGFDPGFSETESVMDRIDGADALDKLRTLDPTYRDPLLMRYVDGLSVKEIAQTMDLTENVISVRLNRGLKKLKEMYTPKQ